jgi:hypothetical protein
MGVWELLCLFHAGFDILQPLRELMHYRAGYDLLHLPLGPSSLIVNAIAFAIAHHFSAIVKVFAAQPLRVLLGVSLRRTGNNCLHRTSQASAWC